MGFSGHESFNCRPLWLKKGIDFVESGRNFNSEEAIMELGVGKNMVASINYWVHAFGLLNEDKRTTELGNFLFGKNGKDPYLENPASLWLLHYSLIKTERASLYNLFFNSFRKERIEFSVKNLSKSVQLQSEREKLAFNENVITRDINVFLKSYLKPLKALRNVEDEYSGLFIDLKIIDRMNRSYDNEHWYRINITERNEIQPEIILFIILDQIKESKSISINILLHEHNSVGNVIPITESGLIEHIFKLQQNYKQLIFKDEAGVKELQFKSIINKWDVLEKYYG